MATIKDVARYAGVSVATVSYVINNKEGVSDELTARVLEAIKALDYRPNRIARALYKKQTHMLGYVVPSIENQFFPRLIHTVEDIAFDNHYGIYLCNTHGSLDRASYYAQNLVESQVDGVVTTLTWDILESGLVEMMQKHNIPVVGLAGARVIDTIDCVTPDDETGAEVATSFLLECGHTAIGFLGTYNSETTKLRASGYLKAMQRHGVEQATDTIELGHSFSEMGGYTLIQSLLQRMPDITAVFVFNDIMAVGVMGALKNIGKSIPQDISVIGFDDSVAGYVHPKLTTMAIPTKEMAYMAMDMLLRRLEGKQSKPRHIKLVPSLIRRESTL